MVRSFEIDWIDHGREPQCQPDPDYPEGRDVVYPIEGVATCKVDLPYPAKRCGMYVVKCPICGVSTGVTTAGRPDDPRSVTMPCNLVGSA